MFPWRLLWTYVLVPKSDTLAMRPGNRPEGSSRTWRHVRAYSSGQARTFERRFEPRRRQRSIRAIQWEAESYVEALHVSVDNVEVVQVRQAGRHLARHRDGPRHVSNAHQRRDRGSLGAREDRLEAAAGEEGVEGAELGKLLLLFFL